MIISKKVYQTIVEQTNEAILIVQNLEIKFLNPAALHLFGYLREEILGQSLIRFTHTEDRAIITVRHAKRMQAALSANADEPPRIYDFRIIRKNREIRWVELKVVPFLWEEKPASLCFLADVTERITMAEERIHHEKLQGVVEMAGAVCHELNQPMQAVYVLADLLTSDLAADHPVSRQIKDIVRQIQKMAEITKKLMRITKYETKSYLKGKIIDIDKAVD